jgi:adenylate cyclase class IV
VALDEVAWVGQFVELELIAEADSLDACRTDLLALAETLGLQAVERRSYLELLLSARGTN